MKPIKVWLIVGKDGEPMFEQDQLLAYERRRIARDNRLPALGERVIRCNLRPAPEGK